MVSGHGLGWFVVTRLTRFGEEECVMIKFNVHLRNKSLGTLRVSDGAGMPQIYHFVCHPQPQLEVKNRN